MFADILGPSTRWRASERERAGGAGGGPSSGHRIKKHPGAKGRVEALTEKSRRGLPFRPLRRVRGRRLWLRRQRHVPTQVDGVFTEEQPHQKRRGVALPNPRRSQQIERPPSPSPKLVRRRHARERRRMPREERERGDAQLVPRVHERAEQRGGDVSAEEDLLRGWTPHRSCEAAAPAGMSQGTRDRVPRRHKMRCQS